MAQSIKSGASQLRLLRGGKAVRCTELCHGNCLILAAGRTLLVHRCCLACLRWQMGIVQCSVTAARVRAKAELCPSARAGGRVPCVWGWEHHVHLLWSMDPAPGKGTPFPAILGLPSCPKPCQCPQGWHRLLGLSLAIY